ncbi:MAG: nucleoside:proton symporter [Proteobacteria bacterium]|nr:nucleoside:proton symporter [Pseudomonadota bacterium]
MQALVGIAVLICISWLMSEAKKSVSWRLVVTAVAIQLALGVLFLKVPFISESLLFLNHIVEVIETATRKGTGFVFGYLGGGPAPFDITDPGAAYVFAFRVLPQILVFSVIVALLWYWRVLPAVVSGFGWLLKRGLSVSGAVGTAAASSVFLGMVETPLVVRAYLAKMSRSELFTLMTCGMSTVAGSIMVLYATQLAGVVDGALGHILAASVLNVIGAVAISRIMIPPGPDVVAEDVADTLSYSSNMDAITRGTTDGLRLAVNVGAMVIVLVSLVALVNGLLGVIEIAGAKLTLERAMGWAFSPIAWLMGIPWSEAITAGALLGTKLILNELLAYIQMSGLSDADLGERSRLIMTYGLCGFANFGSLGIMLGGLSTLVSERRSELLELGPKTLISGTIVTCVTGAIVGAVSLI